MIHQQEIEVFIAELLGFLRAFDVPEDRAVYLCQKTETFIRASQKKERADILAMLDELKEVNTVGPLHPWYEAEEQHVEIANDTLDSVRALLQ